jgi:hypothetical protein
MASKFLLSLKLIDVIESETEHNLSTLSSLAVSRTEDAAVFSQDVLLAKETPRQPKLTFCIESWPGRVSAGT